MWWYHVDVNIRVKIMCVCDYIIETFSLSLSLSLSLTHTHTHTHTQARQGVSVWTHMKSSWVGMSRAFFCLCVISFRSLCIHVCIRVCVCGVCVYIYIYMYVCMHTHTHTHTHIQYVCVYSYTGVRRTDSNGGDLSIYFFYYLIHVLDAQIATAEILFKEQNEEIC